ncbi:MAG: hypothetical protein QXR19_09175 [Candidatus Jordarchaeaceae archaeon]
MIPQNKKGGVFTKKSSISAIILVLIVVITCTLCTTPQIFYLYSFPTHQSLNDKDYQICYRGEPVTLIALMQNETHPIVGELAEFKDIGNGQMIGAAYTNSSGHAVLEWGIPNNYTLGLTVINVSCPSRPDAIPVYIDLLIKARTTFVNLTHTTSAYPGEILIVEADLKDNINNTLPDQQIHLLDHQNVSLNVSVTDLFGHCVLSWLVPSGLTPGVYGFCLRFEGNQTYGSAESVFNVTVLAPRETFFVNLVFPAGVYPGGWLVVEADLMDAANSSLSGQLVYLFDHQNVSLNVSVADLFGHCVLSWLVPSGLTPGVYGFYLRFEGNQTYGSAESVFNVTVLPRYLDVSVTLNATFVKPNEPIYVVVEVSSSDPLVSVRIDGFLLEKAGATSWSGVINASSQLGRHVLSVVVYYNGIECVNSSTTYYVGEEEELGAPLWPLLLFLTGGQGFLREGLIFIAPFSIMAIISAGLALKRRNRQPGYSRDYTIDLDSL